MDKRKKGNAYYQFPLSLLQLYEHEVHALSSEQIANHIIAWTLVDKGATFRKKLSADRYGREDLSDFKFSEVESKASEEGRMPADYSGSELHQAILLMNEEILKQPISSVDEIINRANLVQEYRDEYLTLLGDGTCDTEVRFRFDIVEMLKSGRMDFRPFRVLAGLYAGIGQSECKPVALTWLRYLSAGYKNEGAYEVMPQAWKQATPPRLTDDQLRWTRDKLLDERWLVSYYDGRRRYYSHRSTNGEIAATANSRKTYRLRRQKAEAEAAATVRAEQERLQAEIEALKRK